MPLFSTLVVVCALSNTGQGVKCDVVVADKVQAVSIALCRNKLHFENIKASNTLMAKAGDSDLLPASYNCFETVAARDGVVARIKTQYDKAGIKYTIIVKG